MKVFSAQMAAALLAAILVLPAHAGESEAEWSESGVSEQVYDGLLPTPGQQIIMPAVTNERGRAECVLLLKALMDAPRTLLWKEGRKLKGSWDEVPPGTAIATFKKGRYPQQGRARGSKHAAIFLRATEAGIYVFDQFVGRSAAEERFIPWHHPRDRSPSNNAAAYSTVRW